MDISGVKWLGLTGGIATGKTTACNYLIQKSIPVIDADKISHSLLQAGGRAVNEIVDKFGDNVVNFDGSIARPKLGEIVFKDNKKLLVLNQIMHPLVREITNEMKDDLVSKGHQIIINDVPLLFENNLQNQYDKTILIYCDGDTQVQRLKKRNNFSDSEIEARLKSQMHIEDKKQMADFIINNSFEEQELFNQLDKLISNFS